MAFAVLFHQLLWQLGASYLFTRDDNLTYSLALLHAQTQAYLSGGLPRMAWGLGAGWDPFSSTQLGLFYPIHFLSYGLSFLLGEILWFAEIHFLLHQMILAAMVLYWCPGTLTKRFLLALCLMYVPASFLLGMNWWAYGTAHIWWIGSLLLLHREASYSKPFSSHRSKIILATLMLLNYMSSHPQMFLWGEGLLFLWVLLNYPTHQKRLGLILFLCVLPLLPSLLYIKSLAMVSAVAARPSSLLLESAQPIGVALLGSMVGSLGNFLDVHIFLRPYGEGASLFFQPLTLLCLGYAFYKKRWFLLLLITGCYLFLGAQSFPWLADINLGPLNGFRWTFKLTVLIAPFFILYFVLNVGTSFEPVRLNTILAMLSGFSLLLCFQGRSFDLLGETYGTQNHAGVILDEGQACLKEAKIPSGARLAFVGDYPKWPQPVHLGSLALTGNAALLLGVEATHLYESLEHQDMAYGHLYMNGRHGSAYNTAFMKENWQQALESFRFIGATHLFTLDKNALVGEGVTTCRDRQGAEVTFLPVSNARHGTYPHFASYDVPHHVARLPNGDLWVPKSSGLKPPFQLNTTAPISWIEDEGGWRGYASPVNPLWASSMLFLAGLVFLIFRRWP